MIIRLMKKVKMYNCEACGMFVRYEDVGCGICKDNIVDGKNFIGKVCTCRWCEEDYDDDN